MNRVRQFIKNNQWLLVIVLLSLLLKIGLLLQGQIINPDGALYLSAAKKHAQGLFSEGLAYYRMLFYPLLIAAIQKVIPNWVLVGQLLTIIPLVLVLCPLYVLTRRLFNHQSALWTVLLFSVLPEFNSSDVIRDPLFLLFALSAITFLIICYQDQQFKSLIGFVCFATLAFLMRIEGIILFFIAIITIFLCWQRLTGSNKRGKLLVALILIPAMIGFVLWLASILGIDNNLRLNEIYIWGSDLMTFKFFSNYQQLLAAIEKLQLSLQGGNYHNNLLEVTINNAPLIYAIGLAEMVVSAIYPTSLLAFWAFRYRKQNGTCTDRWLLLLPYVGFIILIIAFLLKKNFIQTRYLWIPITLSLPWVGYGISLWWQERANRKIIATIIIGLIIATPLSRTIAVAAKSPDATIVEAGVWLHEFDPLGEIDTVYSDRRLPFYADRELNVSKVVTFKKIPKFIKRRKKVDLLVLYLSNKKKINYAVSGFKLIKKFQGHKKTVVVLQRQTDAID